MVRTRALSTSLAWSAALLLAATDPLRVASAAEKRLVPKFEPIRSSSQFRTTVLESPSIWAVQFHDESSRDSKMTTGHMNAAATIARGIVKFAVVDGTAGDGATIAKRYGVEEFPSVLIFGDDEEAPTKMEKPFTVEALLKRTMSGAIVDTLTSRSRLFDPFAAGGPTVQKPKPQAMPKVPPKKKKAGEKPPDAAKRETRVVTLTTENYQELVLDNPQPCIVAFVAPWCKFCKKLRPELDEASMKLEGEGAFIGSFSIETVHQSSPHPFLALYRIPNFPTLKMFPGGLNKSHGDAKDYSEDQDAALMVNALLKEVDSFESDSKGIPELTSRSVLEERCGGSSSKICVLVALPHILDSAAAGRDKYLDLLDVVSKRFRGTAFRVLWYEGGSQPALEDAMGMTFGYPAVAALSLGKKAYVVMRGSFNEKAISTFLTGVGSGRQRTTPISAIPEIVTVEEWDGKDGVPFEDEPLDMDWMNDEF